MVQSNRGPRLYRPRPVLARFIDYYGYWAHRACTPHQSRALPRGAVTIVIDVGGEPEIDFFAADGRSRLDVPPAFVAGAGTASYVTGIRAAQTVMTIHFRPVGALPFLSLPLGELENVCVGIADLWGNDAAALRERLVEAPTMAARIDTVESFLLTQLCRNEHRVDGAVAAMLGTLDNDPSVRIAHAADMTGWSAKRLTATFRAQVGMAPKAYQRVRRLQAALRRLDAGGTPGADIAADLGYFDQPHFVREFRAFTTVTPSQYVRRRSWLPGHVELAGAR